MNGNFPPFSTGGTVTTPPDGVVTGVTTTRSADTVTMRFSRSQNLADITVDFVAASSSGGTQVTQRELDIITGGTTINSSNFSDFQNRNNVLFRSNDALDTIFLPLESDIPADQYPVAFEFRMFGGTTDDRSTTGVSLTNYLRIDTQAADTTEVTIPASPTNLIRTSVDLFLGDVGIATKAAAGQNWVVQRTRQDPRTSVLPSGGLLLQDRKASFNSTSITGVGVNTSIQKGYVFEVDQDDATVGPAEGIKAGDLLVAKVTSPSLLKSEIDDNWHILQDYSNFPLTLDEIRLLSQFSSATALEPTELLVNTRWWVLDSAPTSAPSLVDAGQDSFLDTESKSDKFLLVALPIDTDPDRVVFRDENSTDTAEDTQFSQLFTSYQSVIPDASGRRYYIFGSNPASPTGFNYTANHELSVQSANAVARYTARPSVDATAGLREIQLSQLSDNIRNLLQSGTGLLPVDVAKIDGLEASRELRPFDSNTSFEIAFGDADLGSNTYNTTAGNSITPATYVTKVQVLVPAGSTVTSLRKISNNSVTLTPAFIGTVKLSNGQARDHYQFVLPAEASGTTLANAYEVVGDIASYTLTGAHSTFKIELDNIAEDLKPQILNGDSSLGPVLTNLKTDLTQVQATTPATWGGLPDTKLIREAAALIDENRHSFTGNYFSDLDKVIGSGFNANAVFWYNEADSVDPTRNRFMTGRQSFIYNDNFRLRNDTGGTNIQNVIGKVFTLDYSLTRPITVADGDQPIVRFGNSPMQPLISISHNDGLAVYQGRQDGVQQTRTIRSYHTVDNPQWAVQQGQTPLIEESFVRLSDVETGETVSVEVHGFNNNNDAGTHTENYVITDKNTAQSFGARNYTYGAHTLSVTASYNPAETINGETVPALQLVATLNTPTYHFNVLAYKSNTETWNAPNTYAKVGINTGSAFDQFGAYDPSLFNTEQAGVTQTLTIEIVPAVDGDTSPDPEVALIVIVNGQLMGDPSNGYKIPLRRQLSTLNLADFNVGNGQTAVSNLQLYRYTTQPTIDELRAYDTHRNSFLGQFRNAVGHIDRYVLAADWELTAGHAVILTDTQTGTRKKLVITNGAIVISDA